jgi:hypothetical protein
MRKKAPPGNYDVGYRKPPKHTQFQPGESGNPRGRPKDSKNFSSRVKSILDRKITITENGRTRRITMAEAVVMKLVSRAMASDMSAMRLTLGLIQLSQSEATPVESVFDSEADRALLLSYIDEAEGTEGASKPRKAKTRKKKESDDGL